MEARSTEAAGQTNPDPRGSCGLCRTGIRPDSATARRSGISPGVEHRFTVAGQCRIPTGLRPRTGAKSIRERTRRPSQVSGFPEPRQPPTHTGWLARPPRRHRRLGVDGCGGSPPSNRATGSRSFPTASVVGRFRLAGGNQAGSTDPPFRPRLGGAGCRLAGGGQAESAGASVANRSRTRSSTNSSWTISRWRSNVSCSAGSHGVAPQSLDSSSNPTSVRSASSTAAS